ncbi:MAG: 2-C-methyl-D-erythritol 4-phosphate cytidylyltransferase [Lachnospiraceae bacterium]|nr:2-C-methyl-D-erythritol 4-phosphate cytidylyltransferase [Lachnospiraceae bacterium]
MNVALILSGGTGTRLGSNVPKQYIEVGGSPIICYSVRCLSKHSGIDAIQIVADPTWYEQIEKWLQVSETNYKLKGFAMPGANRQLSIYNGLEAISSYVDNDDYVLIHDAARPLLSPTQISDCLEAIHGHDGVLPVLPMKDTVYSSTDGKTINSLLNRKEIYAGQAPELFRFGKYYEANRRLLPDQILQINGSTEPAILAGMDIAMISGDENNFKITTGADLERFRRIVGENEMFVPPWV